MPTPRYWPALLFSGVLAGFRPSYAPLSRAELAKDIAARRAAGGPLPELLERLTRGMIGAPFSASPLGEGAPPDTDPRFRLDAFDCTTFVETALALARSETLEGTERALDAIRYEGGTPSFARRRHLIASQWVPAQIQAGLVEDITEQVGGRETEVVRFTLTRERWKNRTWAEKLELGEDDISYGTFAVRHVPLQVMRKRLDKVPPGTILNVVRSDHPEAPDVITHQALVITRPGDARRYVRHSTPRWNRVKEETLKRVIMRYVVRREEWPIVGINLLRVVDPRRE